MANVVSLKNIVALKSILLVLFLLTSNVLGTIKAIGVFLPELESTLGITATDIGVALGLFNAFAFGPGVIIAYLYQRLQGGYRRFLVTTGAILIPGGHILASLATNNIQLATCLSANGLGCNILSICIVIALSEQSGDAFGTFFGIGKSGYAVGMALVPLLAAYLMDIYGWRGSLMIIGGIMAHLIPLTMMVELNAGQTTQITPTNSVDHLDKKEVTKEESMNSGTVLLEEVSNVHRDEIASKGSLIHGSPLNQDIHTEKDKGALTSDDDDDDTINDSTRLIERPLSPQPRQRDQAELDTPRGEKNFFGETTPCSDMWDTAGRLLTNSAFNRDRLLILLMFVTFIFAMGDGGWFAFLIPRAVSRGIPTGRALFLSYSAAIATFIGRVVGSLLRANFKLFSDQVWFLLLTLLNITSLLVDIFVSNFVLMIVTSFITSLTISERNIIIVVVCNDRASKTEFPLILATSEAVYGVGSLIGTSIAGFVADEYGSFNASYMFIVAVDMMVFCLMIPSIVAEFHQRRERISY